MGRLTSDNKEIKTLQPKNESYWLQVYWKLKAYEDAEEQGLLLKLPCKVGDTVYQIMIVGLDKDKNLIYKVFEAKVIQYILDSYTLCFGTVTDDHYRCKNNMTAAEFGKTVFLTKEEAEAALERMKVE